MDWFTFPRLSGIGYLIWSYVKILMTLFPVLKRTLVVYGILQQNVYSNDHLLTPVSKSLLEGKTLDDQLFAVIHFSENKEYILRMKMRTSGL